MDFSNIERFDHIVAKVLGELYSAFPCPKTLPATDFVEEALTHSDFIGADVASENGEFFNHTIQWLADAGYLKMSELETQLAIARGAVLTAKGLEALRAMPGSLEGKSSLGERLAEQAKSSSGEGIKALVGEVIGAAVRGMTGI